jgi:hypothetical protein
MVVQALAAFAMPRTSSIGAIADVLLRCRITIVMHHDDLFCIAFIQ